MKAKKEHLTKKLVAGLDLPEKKPVFIWDTEIRGFGIKLNPTNKTFVAQGRVKGMVKRVNIGEFGPWTVDNARKKAQQLILDMHNGIDPNKEKKIKKVQSRSLDEVVKDYIKDRSLKQLTVRDINTHLNGIFSEWKDQPILNITRDKVLKLYRQKSEESPAQANQAFRVLRALMNYARAAYRADDTPIIIENPVLVISDLKIWNSIKPKNRRIPLDQIGKAWNLLVELRNNPAYGIAGKSLADCVTFALLTGARWGECQKLAWDNVNLETGTWHIADPKNKESVTLPLSIQALDMLKNRTRLEDNNFVFCSDQSKTGHIGTGRFITDQIAKALKIELSPHDLRRTFRAIAAECEIELWRTKLLLNHKIRGDITIEAYTEKADLEYLRPAIQKISDWIERQAKVDASEKVVDLGQARKNKQAV